MPRSLLHDSAALHPGGGPDDPHDADVCETIIHYLPWVLIVTMVLTVFASSAVVAIVVSKRIARRD